MSSKGVIDKMAMLVMLTNAALNPFGRSWRYVDVYEVDFENVSELYVKVTGV